MIIELVTGSSNIGSSGGGGGFQGQGQRYRIMK